jgi:DNA repair exonuclease SbcCD nuclease subunit
LFKNYPNINYFDTIEQIELDGSKITLCPWGLNPLDSNLDNTQYLFGHFEINTFQLTTSGQLCEDGFKLSDLFKKYQNIYSGHFHKSQNRVYSAGTVQYVGNPFQMNFGESGEKKGFIILDLKTNTFEYFYNNLSPKFINIQLSNLIKLTQEKIQKLFKNNFIRLSLDKNITTTDLDELLKLLTTCKPNEIDVDWDNTSINSTKTTKTDFEALELLTVLTEYTKLLDINNQKEVIDYLTVKYKALEA